VTANLHASKRKSLRPTLAAILPVLMLCVSSCATVSRPSVSLAAGTPQGNAYRLALPAGTTIALPNEAAAAQVRAVAVNELVLARPAAAASTVTLRAPLQLVSPGYMARRDAEEISLLKLIADLKEENARLRAR
jgi:hypothetical protein